MPSRTIIHTPLACSASSCVSLASARVLAADDPSYTPGNVRLVLYGVLVSRSSLFPAELASANYFCCLQMPEKRSEREELDVIGAKGVSAAAPYVSEVADGEQGST